MRGVCNSPRPHEKIIAMDSEHQTERLGPEPLYLQTPAAAARLGLAPATLEKMRVRGDGPPFCRWSRRRIVYAVAAIDQWAREREHRSTKEYSAAAA
jgi:hypothetical protein